MTGARGIEVRRISIRVALAATAVVAVAYFVIAVAVFLIVTNNLTAQVDERVAMALNRFGGAPAPPPGGGGFQPPDVGPRFGPALLVWTILADGTVISVPNEIELPAEYQAVTGPRTVSIEGVDLRIQGRETVDGWVVIGQTMGSVAQAQGTLLLAEIAIAPILLLVVFLGAVAIGRRAAAPIEAARRRQLEFTADASHELRTPLSVIEAETSLALARDREAHWYRDAFRRVDGESQRMRRLLDDLLWLARFDAARESHEAEPVDVGVLAAQAADRFRSVAEARGIVLAVDVPDDPLTVVAPADWLDRLMGVLLDNACKYSPAGGQVRVAALQAGNRVELTVEDSGPGIPEEERARIFDRFHRASGPGTGAGLGLAIGDAVVRSTAGRWRISSSPAGGAAMTVSWPAVSRGHVAGQPGGAGAAREPDPARSLGSPRS
ncbi:MAG: heavy metal sensor signal transduction histidine kinase [Chloroflexi bacterium]|nr:heavy metal sensor signal transduction histidine kinase [Chloroflexota bacterium]